MKFPKKLNLANIPTPVQKKIFNGTGFFIKRDDFTGVELSGNKVRKLEYLLYKAKRQKAAYVFTCGGEQSNHSRATAVAAASLGIKTKLFLWGNDKRNAEGNLFLDKMVNAEFEFLNKQQYFHVNEIMQAEKEKYERKGKKVFIIPEGGTSPLGIWGYINFVKELQSQINKSKIKGILVAAGSGGTAAGLLIGTELYDFNVKIYAVNVLYSSKKIFQKIQYIANKCNENYDLKLKPDYNKLQILDGYSTEGYKHITEKKLKLIKNFAVQTGILLDPAYTGKAFYAFNDIFLKNKNKTGVLFVHTGGIFGAFAKRTKYLNLN